MSTFCVQGPVLSLGPSHRGGTLLASFPKDRCESRPSWTTGPTSRGWEMGTPGTCRDSPHRLSHSPHVPLPPSQTYSQEGGSPAWCQKGRPQTRELARTLAVCPSLTLLLPCSRRDRTAAVVAAHPCPAQAVFLLPHGVMGKGRMHRGLPTQS